MPMMMQVSRSMPALGESPSAVRESAQTPPSERASSAGTASTPQQATTAAAASLKPFFLMDWLEELAADQDLNQLARLLKTPHRKNKKFLEDGRDDLDGDEDDDPDFDDDGYGYSYCTVSPPSTTAHRASTTTGMSIQDADPETPKSSNRRNVNKAFPTSLSCPLLKNDDDFSNNTRSRSTSPLRPKQLLFGKWLTSRTSSNSDSNDSSAAGETATATSASTATNTGSSALARKSTSRRRNRSPQSIYRKSIQLGNAWNAKGLHKARQGMWHEALRCWDNALEIRLHLLGKTHVDVANTCNNRGIALGQVGEYVQALESLQQALDIRWHLLQSSDDEEENKQANHDSIISTLHNIANVHQQAGELDRALQVLGQARDVATEQQSSPTNSTKIPVARLCAAMGHIYAQAEQWIDARDAYLDACQWYRMERQRQQGLCKASEDDDDALTAAILTCQQELSDVEKDLEEIMTHRLVVAAPVASPLFASLVAPPRMPRSLLQAKPW